MRISDISEAELPMQLQGLGQLTKAGVKLARGSRGDDVKSLQKLLTTFGYPLSADGIFGPATEAAVKQVQAKLGLVVTGYWDETTASKVNAVTKSGVIDADPKDKSIVTMAGKTAEPPVLNIAPSAPPSMLSPPAGAPGSSGYLDSLKEKFRAFIQSPNYPFFVAGALAIVGIGVWMLWRPSGTKLAGEPVQLGLPKTTRRRSSVKKTKKKSAKKSAKKS